MLTRFKKSLFACVSPKSVRVVLPQERATIVACLQKTLFCLLLVLFAFSQAVYGAGHKVTRVYDGDTLRVMGDSGELTIRLVRIDAPKKSRKKREPGQPFGQKAKEYLAGLVLNRAVDVKKCLLEPYGRIPRIVNQRLGSPDEFLLTEKCTASAMSVFHFDIPGQVATSSHAGIP
jgi:hypothetical protein